MENVEKHMKLQLIDAKSIYRNRDPKKNVIQEKVEWFIVELKAKKVETLIWYGKNYLASTENKLILLGIIFHYLLCRSYEEPYISMKKLCAAEC